MIYNFINKKLTINQFFYLMILFPLIFLVIKVFKKINLKYYLPYKVAQLVKPSQYIIKSDSFLV